MVIDDQLYIKTSIKPKLFPQYKLSYVMIKSSSSEAQTTLHHHTTLHTCTYVYVALESADQVCYSILLISKKLEKLLSYHTYTVKSAVSQEDKIKNIYCTCHLDIDLSLSLSFQEPTTIPSRKKIRWVCQRLVCQKREFAV